MSKCRSLAAECLLLRVKIHMWAEHIRQCVLRQAGYTSVSTVAQNNSTQTVIRNWTYCWLKLRASHHTQYQLATAIPALIIWLISARRTSSFSSQATLDKQPLAFITMLFITIFVTGDACVCSTLLNLKICGILQSCITHHVKVSPKRGS